MRERRCIFEGVCFEVDDVFGPDMVVVVLLEEATLVVDMTIIKESQGILRVNS